MTNKEETVIATETYTVATASLQKQVAEELDVPDPEPEVAKATIDENVMDAHDEQCPMWGGASRGAHNLRHCTCGKRSA